jgi:hypothetical protein
LGLRHSHDAHRSRRTLRCRSYHPPVVTTSDSRPPLLGSTLVQRQSDNRRRRPCARKRPYPVPIAVDDTDVQQRNDSSGRVRSGDAVRLRSRDCIGANASQGDADIRGHARADASGNTATDGDTEIDTEADSETDASAGGADDPACKRHESRIGRSVRNGQDPNARIREVLDRRRIQERIIDGKRPLPEDRLVNGLGLLDLESRDPNDARYLADLHSVRKRRSIRLPGDRVPRSVTRNGAARNHVHFPSGIRADRRLAWRPWRICGSDSAV